MQGMIKMNTIELEEKTMTKNGSSKPRGASPADKKLGLRIRTARTQANLSQTDLGAALGVSFQQVQKYEKGINRVSAPRVSEIAKATGQPMSYFTDDLHIKRSAKADQFAEFMATREANQIIDIMILMKPPLRQQLINVARSLAGDNA
jgi:transcriptional regulator with XRE-family HTH domain